jgi:UDP-N-acetylglucosamine--N-acetylmuramyl-(pentapeptide) pyrophosphoryl-undecaprenol N-acetylglucosamine transferase
LVALAASILKIPVVLHEQTQNAGLSGKLIAKVASVICVSFDTSLKHFKNKNVLLTGNPIREEILKTKNLEPQTSKPIVYITGGSTGSHAINNVVYEILQDDVVVKEKYNLTLLPPVCGG